MIMSLTQLNLIILRNFHILDIYLTSPSLPFLTKEKDYGGGGYVRKIKQKIPFFVANLSMFPYKNLYNPTVYPEM